MVFDFDGTLAVLNIDFAAMRDAILVLIKDAGLSLGDTSRLQILELIDCADAHLVAQHRPETRASFRNAAYRIVQRIEMEAAQKGMLQPMVRELLAVLRERSLKIGVVTRNCRSAVYRIFPDINRFCHVVVTREETRHVKPHPEHLRSTLERLAVQPALAVMIGDHPMDIRLGKAAGTDTIGVLTGSTDRETLMGEYADFVIPRVDNLLHLLS